MPALEFSVVIAAKGREYDVSWFRRRLHLFDQTWSDLPNRVRERIPKNVHTTMAKNVRKYMQENYLSHYKWKAPNKASSTYGPRKDRMYRTKDSFDIAGIGNFEIAHTSADYGRRTGTLYRYIGSPEGSEASIRWIRGGLVRSGARRRSIDAVIGVAIRDDAFGGGGYNRYYRGAGEPRAQSTSNLMQAMSWLQSGKNDNPEDSVFIKLRPEQVQKLRTYTERVWGVRTRNLAIAAVKGLTS